jgi:hypothetical protein
MAIYGGEGRGSGHQKGYFKGKRKIKIEELKLRTRCGRCGEFQPTFYVNRWKGSERYGKSAGLVCVQRNDVSL